MACFEQLGPSCTTGTDPKEGKEKPGDEIGKRWVKCGVAKNAKKE
jgi:hypothetical protein